MGTPNLDRFSGVEPKEPIEVGDCDACSDMMDAYEKVKCEMCDASIHQECCKHCDYCGKPGCGVCMKLETDTLLYICCQCQEVRAKRIEMIRCLNIPGYWYAGNEENEDENIVEFISADGPKILIHIRKRETKC